MNKSIIRFADRLSLDTELPCFYSTLHPIKSCPLRGVYARFTLAFSNILYPNAKVQFVPADAFAGTNKSSLAFVYDGRVHFTHPVYTLNLRRARAARSFYGPWNTGSFAILYRKDIIPPKAAMTVVDVYPPMIVLTYISLRVSQSAVLLGRARSGLNQESFWQAYVALWFTIIRYVIRANIIHFYNKPAVKVASES